MKKYIKEIIILILQILLFYLYPIYAINVDPIGMMITIIIGTILLSFILGLISNERIIGKYALVVAILFLPTIFIYYNLSAISELIWCFFGSTIGLMSGMVLKIIIKKIIKSRDN